MTSRHKDRGWAWVVLFAAYMNLLIGPGLAFVGGIFQTEFLEHFQQSVTLTSWVTSLFASLLQLAGPVSSVVSSHFSCRVSVMTGAVLLSSGLAISSFVNDIYLLLIFMGIVSGLGLGLTYSPSVVIVNLYFEKKRTFVTGLALSASGVGILVLSQLTRYLLDTVSWHETLAILAALSLQMLVFGALMFPDHEQNLKNTKCCMKCLKRQDSTTYDVPSDKFLNLRIMPNNNQNTATILENDEHSNGVLASSKLLVLKKQKEYDDVALNDVMDDVWMTNLHTKPLYFNLPFIILCVNLFLANSAMGIFFIHFPSFALDAGVTSTEVAFAMSMNGLSLTISRILVGAMGNDENIDPLSVYVGLIGIAGVLLSLVPIFATTAVANSLTMALLGVYMGGAYSFLTVITIECVGLNKLSTAFGWEMIFAGSGYLIAPPIAGWIVDTTGLYGNGIYLSGGLLIMSSLVMLFIPACTHLTIQNPLRRRKNQTIVVDSKTQT